jgi:hypothetical protein
MNESKHKVENNKKKRRLDTTTRRLGNWLIDPYQVPSSHITFIANYLETSSHTYFT